MNDNTQTKEELQEKVLQKLNIPEGFSNKIRNHENKDEIITLLVSTYALGYADCKREIDKVLNE